MTRADHLTIVDHPLVQHKLTLMRDRSTPTAVFRELLREISHLLAYEVTRDLPMTTKTIDTPLVEMEAPTLKGKKLALIPGASGAVEGGEEPGANRRKKTQALAVRKIWKKVNANESIVTVD